MKKIYLVLATIMFCTSIHSQTSIPTIGVAVVENFTGYLGTSTLPLNWTISGSGTNGNSFRGTTQTTGTSGGWYGNNNMSFLGSGTASAGNATWRLQNNTGVTISGFTLSFLARMWKIGSSSPIVSVTYSTNATGTVPGAGALTPITSFSDATTIIGTGSTISTTISSISVPNGNYIYIRFIHAGGSSSDNLGWDDVSLTPSAASPTKYWDGNGAATGVGFSNTWGTTFSTSATGNIATVAAATTDDIIYEGTPGTVTLGASQTVNSHTFNVADYILATSANSILAGTVALGSNTLTLAPGASNNLTLPGVISGTGGLTQNGAGNTILSGTNTYTGTTTVTAGSLSVAANENLGSGTSVLMNGGTLATTGSFSLSKTISLAATSTINTVASTILSYTGAAISGAGGLIKSGLGTFSTPITNTYTGKTFINGGTFATNTENAFGANPGAFTSDQITINGGGIQADGGNINFNDNRGLTLGASGAIFNTVVGSRITAANVITGTGGFIKIGTGTLRFGLGSGTHTYTGTTTITQGVLQLETANNIPDASNVLLNGGTLTTARSSDGVGQADDAGTLALTASSIIALGTGNHTLSFSNPLGIYNGVLTINGWTGTAGVSGTDGKIRIGTTAVSLTPAQKAQILFTGYTQGAVIQLADGEIVPIESTITLSSLNPAVTAGSITQNTINNVIYRFDLSVATANASLTAVTINTSGTYLAADISNFKCWYSADAVFSSGTDILLSTKNTALGTGAHIFPGFTAQAIAAGNTGYIFITTDVPCTAVAARTIIVNAINTADITFAGGIKTGSASAGGTQNIASATPINATLPTTSNCNNSGTTISWVAPTGCSDAVLVFAKAGTFTTAVPSGDGTTFTANTAFGSGTGFDGGFCVFKGTGNTVNVTALTVNTAYTYKIFTRNDLNWSSGVTTGCTPAPSTVASDYFRSNVATGNWSTASSWQSSSDDINYYTATTSPTSTATAITIRNGNKIVINAAGVSMTNTTVQNGAVLEITTSSSFDLSGSAGGKNIQLTINDGGEFLVNSSGSPFSSPTGNGFGMVETGGKLVAGPLLGSGTSFSDAYLGRLNGIFYFGDAAICEWLSTARVLGSSSPLDPDFFYPDNTTDMPIFRISVTPGFAFGSSVDNIFYSILEIVGPAIFRTQNGGTKTFNGGVRGTGTLLQNSGSGNIILGDGSNIPVIDGTVTLNILSSGLRLPSGAIVPLGASATIMSSAQNNSINRTGGNLTVDGTLDITNMRITNTASGGVVINGTLRTSNTGGLYGSGSAIVNGTLNLNNGSSTVEYYAAASQSVTSRADYYNLVLSGSGTKTPSGTFSPLGTVTISESAIFDCTGRNIGNGSTSLTMTGGKLIVSTNGTQPSMAATYNLTGGVVDFAGSGSQSIRTQTYQNIEVTGVGVGNSLGNITLNSNGTFTVKSTGIFEINADAIVGPGTNETVTVENGGIFRTGDVDGFSGATNTSIRNDIQIVSLLAGSTVEYIRNGNQAITGAHDYSHLLLTGTGVKTAPINTLTVQGNLIKAGTSTFVPNDGLVLLNGTNQNFAGLKYSQLEMTGGTKTTVGGASIDSLLKINVSTTLSITANDSITILSSDARTASIAKLDASAVINYDGLGISQGKFVMERYLLSGRKWRLLSVPTINPLQTIRSSWQLSNGVTASGYGFLAADTRSDYAARGFDVSGNNSSVKKFNVTAQAWDAVDNTNTLNTNDQRGYLVFVPGDRSVTWPNAGATVLRTTGQIYRGNYAAIPLTGEKYEILGNPYPSRINIENFSFTNLDFSFAVWDPSLTGPYGLGTWNYLYLDPFDSKWKNLNASTIYGAEDSYNPYIESGMAFMAKAGTGGGSFTFLEDSKIPGSEVSAFVSGNPQAMKVNLNLAYTNGNAPLLLDGILANFDATFTNGINNYDIKKMGAIGEEVSFKTNNLLLAIDRRFDVVNNDTLHMNISKMRVQNYLWEINTTNMDYPGRTGFLIDRYLNTSTPLNMAGTTTVNFNVANIAGSYAADRFKIVFNQQALGPVPVAITAVSATRNQNRSIDVNWKVENETNISSYEVERSADGSNFGSINSRAALVNNGGRASYNHNDLLALPADNFYRIKATSIGGQVQYSAIVKVGALKQPNSISVYPNPVVDGNLQLRFNGQVFGNYQVQLSNAAGQVLYKSNVAVSSAVQSQLIALPASITSGSYQLRVIGADGEVSVVQVMIK